jgi:hypothetical protein
VDAEIEHGVCPACHAPLGSTPGPFRRADPTPAPNPTPGRRRAIPFLLGLFIGCLISAAALWAAVWLGAPLPGADTELPAALPSVRPEKTEANNPARKARADLQAAKAARQAAEAARAQAVKALDAANQRTAAALKQKDDADQQLQSVLARLAQEQGQRASLEKALAEFKKPRPAPTQSFVRDWQLLGPFPSTADQGHDAVFPPEREPIQMKKTYDGFGGLVKWRPYHSAENKIDLAAFFNYRQAGAAYAVSWVHSDRDQPVTLGIGSDDGIRLWVNGVKVHDVKGGRQARPGQDMVKARLRKGWNEIRAKVDNIFGTWELYLEFRTADGGQPLKLFSTDSPPPTTAR